MRADEVVLYPTETVYGLAVNPLSEAALDKLYAEKPAARNEIKSAKGYAVFSSIGVNLFLVSTERGGGILRDNRSGKDIYMKMFSAGGGVGMGVKDFAVVFIFHTETAMDDFQKEGCQGLSCAADSSSNNNQHLHRNARHKTHRMHRLGESPA